MIGQTGILAFCFEARGLVFIQEVMINDKSNALPFSKRAFSEVLGGAFLKNFSWIKPPSPRFLPSLL